MSARPNRYDEPAPARVVEPHHWALWAVEERCPGEGLNLGLPRQSPFYTQTRRRESDDEGPPPPAPDMRDRLVARLIGTCVAITLEASDKDLARTFYGAHPGASASPTERMVSCCQITKKGESATRNAVKIVQARVEGWVTGAIMAA